jgi:hypothetical protein
MGDIIAVGEAGYGFDPENVTASNFDVGIYHVETMRELAKQFVDEGLFGEIPDHLANDIDLDAIARDLAVDYTETEIAGERLIYRARYAQTWLCHRCAIHSTPCGLYYCPFHARRGVRCFPIDRLNGLAEFIIPFQFDSQFVLFWYVLAKE